MLMKPIAFDPRPCRDDDALAREITARVMNEQCEFSQKHQKDLKTVLQEDESLDSFHQEFELVSPLKMLLQLL